VFGFIARPNTSPFTDANQHNDGLKRMQALSFSPIDFHCHGVGRFDFADPDRLALDELEAQLSVEGVRCILTLYLPRSQQAAFERFVHTYWAGRCEGRYPHILGIALEGPMLASFGGTPETGCWQPTKAEWERIASLGRHGLIYVVLAPDATLPQSAEYFSSPVQVMEELIAGGVIPAFGHFSKKHPGLSAEAIYAACEWHAALGLGPLLTDHLFNDMPLNFKHCWRTEAERGRRAEDLADFLRSPWSDGTIEHTLGAVPAALVRGARNGSLKTCMNFDGDHVDLDICKATVDFVGAANMLLMTDRIQSGVLGGQTLSRRADNSLMYQSRGIVAGGTQSVMRQLGNMLKAGISSADILQISQHSPQQFLDRRSSTSVEPAAVAG
jgi:N-acetylglucosamine-6-phosphate deacetylase